MLDFTSLPGSYQRYYGINVNVDREYASSTGVFFTSEASY